MKPIAVVTSILACLLSAAAESKANSRFDFDDVAAVAEQLARKPFVEPENVPEWLTEITYDQWRNVRFRPEHSLWRDTGVPFEVQFFHPGLYYDRTVRIHEIDAEGVHDVPFSPSDFDYGGNTFSSQVPQDLGFAGFRLHYPLKTAKYKDEVIVFLGASYFRAVGADNVFGLSARGVAVDTALPSGEEFPYFREFWLVRPARTAKELAIYALLDSPRVTGAYRFVIHPGSQTLVDVQMRLYFRDRIGKLGIAPLTSMFFHGENTDRFFSDYRPEVHDSDGLMIVGANGEWLWRPLDNPESLRVNAFEGSHVAGFGLIQRDREFDHYQDLEAHPHRRPSMWIAPKSDWGEGSIELVEIPTNSDVNDNVVSYWVPRNPPPADQPFELSYRLSAYTEDSSRPPAGRVAATRRDRGTGEDTVRFVIDFGGKELQALSEETVLRAMVTTARSEQAEILEQQVIKNPITGLWRLVFQLRPLGSDPIELRAFLQSGDKALTETWSYVVVPE